MVERVKSFIYSAALQYARLELQLATWPLMMRLAGASLGRDEPQRPMFCVALVVKTMPSTDPSALVLSVSLIDIQHNVHQ